MLNVTEKEMAVLKVIADCMNMYQDGFSDITMDDLVANTELPVNTVKGVLGSLEKKNMIYYMDVNGEENIYYIDGGAAQELLDFEIE